MCVCGTNPICQAETTATHAHVFAIRMLGVLSTLCFTMLSHLNITCMKYMILLRVFGHISHFLYVIDNDNIHISHYTCWQTATMIYIQLPLSMRIQRSAAQRKRGCESTNHTKHKVPHTFVVGMNCASQQKNTFAFRIYS